jgi:threonine dehydrogenase-like Zn-dependent dehydrogenase
MEQAIQSVAVFGRVGMVGLGDQKITIDPYNQLLMKEAEIIGVADHLAQEIPILIEYVRRGNLDLSHVISDIIPLDAVRINQALDQLDTYTHKGRVVITP